MVYNCNLCFQSQKPLLYVILRVSNIVIGYGWSFMTYNLANLNPMQLPTIYTKYDTKDTLCDDHDNTCVTVLETLEMSVIHVYMVRP